MLLSPPEILQDFWVRDGVYYAGIGRNGERFTVALHGVINDEQAAAAVAELRRCLPQAFSLPAS